MKPTSQPTLPGVRVWTQPITVRGSELAQAIAEAQAAGWTAHRMKVLPEVIYELQFWRITGTAEAGKQFKEFLTRIARQGSPCIPDSFYDPKLLTVSVSHE